MFRSSGMIHFPEKLRDFDFRTGAYFILDIIIVRYFRSFERIVCTPMSRCAERDT